MTFPENNINDVIGIPLYSLFYNTINIRPASADDGFQQTVFGFLKLYSSLIVFGSRHYRSTLFQLVVCFPCWSVVSHFPQWADGISKDVMPRLQQSGSNQIHYIIDVQCFRINIQVDNTKREYTSQTYWKVKEKFLI